MISEPGKSMYFNNWFEETPIEVKILDGKVYLDGNIMIPKLKVTIPMYIKKKESQ
jgi:hypothetical protein